jgi:single-strand DNA-binding protein
MYLNKAIVYGNLTKDPEIKALPSGIKVASFGVATNRVWKDKEGRKQESADFHNIVLFGKQAELAGQYLKKGSGLLVEGRMQTRSWDAQDGTKKYRTEIVAEKIQFGPRAAGGSTGGSYEPKTESGSQSAGAKAPKDDSGPAIQYPEEEINIEDIPF